MMWRIEWGGICGILYEKRGELGGRVFRYGKRGGGFVSKIYCFGR